MRTTLTIDSHVLGEFKRRAAESHRTISSLIEDALREHLSRGRDQAATKPLDFPIVGGHGVAPGVDLTSNAALSEYVDGADPAHARLRDRERGEPPRAPAPPTAGPDAPDGD